MYQESILTPVVSRVVDCLAVDEHIEPDYSLYIFAMSPNERFATFQVVSLFSNPVLKLYAIASVYASVIGILLPALIKSYTDSSRSPRVPYTLSFEYMN